MSIYKSPICSCIICHKEYSQMGIQTHFIREHTNTFSTDKIKQLCSAGGKAGLGRNYNKNIVKWKEYYSNPKKCQNCNKDIDWFRRNNKSCSHSCSTSLNNKTRTHSEETKQKISLSSIGRKIINAKHYKVIHVSQCKICNKYFIGNKVTCSRICFSKIQSINGRNNAAKIPKRSKDEISLYNLCVNHFDKVTSNEQIFNGWDADILIYDTKTAILWNGPWHYQEMGFSNHSLKQVQNRDKIKIKEIINLGWSVKIFEDRYFTPESAFKSLLER